MIRWYGALLVLIGSSVLGIIHAVHFRERCRVLREWLIVLENLKTAISYNTSLLPDVFAQIALMSDDSCFHNSFEWASRHLKYGSGDSVSQHWDIILHRTSDNILKQTDFVELRRVGAFLGNSDIRNQLEKLDLALANLRNNLNQAVEEMSKHTALSGYGGFAGGAMLLLLMMR